MCGFTCSIGIGCGKTPTPSVDANGNIHHQNGICNVSSNGNHAPAENGTITSDYAVRTTNGVEKDGSSSEDVAETMRAQLQSSLAAISHRGPDAHHTWMNDDLTVCLGHCRLSVNDLSPSGEQPLHSDCGEIHAVVNGEIYDFDRLRKLCSTVHGYSFHSQSDSELVVALYRIFGSPALFEHLRGEFSFVLYDAREGSKKVIAGRDRFGIKPLFWTKVDGRLLFASETKAFLSMGWKPEWNVEAIATAGCMMGGPRTLFKGVNKVHPGHFIEVTEEEGMKEVRYWDAEYEDKNKVETRTIDEMILGVRERLVESIRLRMRADVPVGVYLSGGIDSSAVAGIVTHLAHEKHIKIGSRGPMTNVACFSIGFPETSGYDESGIADRTAKWLGIETVKERIDEAKLASDFGDAVFHCEQDIWDLNFVAKFALSRLPRRHGFKVVLTGEGADEHFAGYPFLPVEFLREADAAMPESELTARPELRKEVEEAVAAETRKIWSMNGLDPNMPHLPDLAKIGNSGMATSLAAWAPYTIMFASWVRVSQGGTFDCRKTTIATHRDDVHEKMREKWHPLHTALYLWNKSCFPNTLLTSLGDRTEMAHSIEARTPFLDHHLAEYVNSLPPSVKLSYTPPVEGSGTAEGKGGGPIWAHTAKLGLQSLTEKWILREAVKPFITDELYRRRKHPFLAPTKWPKDGPLNHMFARLLTREAVESVGFLDWDVVSASLAKAFGDDGEPRAFRIVCQAAAFVTIGQRFGVRKAEVDM